jgi:hypothetical protein
MRKQKILERVADVMMMLVLILLTISYLQLYKKHYELENKVKQIELDYKFLEYNTSQMEEYYENR